MVQIETLANGLTVILEQIPNVESVAYELQIPGGIILDDEAAVGASLVLAELTSRGAGSLGSRELSDAFENRGIRHGESAGHDRFVYRGLLLSEHLDEALRLVSLMVREPSLPEQEIDNIRNILLQDIASLADDPARRSMVELFQRYYPAPFGRPGHGSAEGIASVERDHGIEIVPHARHRGPRLVDQLRIEARQGVQQRPAGQEFHGQIAKPLHSGARNAPLCSKPTSGQFLSNGER